MQKDFSSSNFWNTIEGPIVGLSPMDGVTDAPMRFISKKYGRPDIIYTEFVSAEGLWRIKKRGEMEHRIWNELKFDESERPVIAQIFGSDPESFYEAAKIVCELGFDGIDINMGCPSPGLEKRGGGAGLIRDKCNAVEVVEATRRGINDFFQSVRSAPKPYSDLPGVPGSRLRAVLASAPAPLSKSFIPVSVKTRIGSEAPDPAWWKVLADMRLPAVAMHGRTFKQLYSGEADWDSLFRAAEIIRDSGAKFLGNGDIKSISVRSAQKSCSDPTALRLRGPLARDFVSTSAPSGFFIELKSGREMELTGKMDGVLIGREAMGNPWVLQKRTQGFENSRTQDDETRGKLAVMVEHAKKYQEIFNQDYDEKFFQFFPMRKHLACYARGFEGSVGLRKKLMAAEDAEQVEMMVEEFIEGVSQTS